MMKTQMNSDKCKKCEKRWKRGKRGECGECGASPVPSPPNKWSYMPHHLANQTLLTIQEGKNAYGKTINTYIGENTNLLDDLINIVVWYSQPTAVRLELAKTAKFDKIEAFLKGHNLSVYLLGGGGIDTYEVEILGIRYLELGNLLGNFIKYLVRIKSFGQSLILPGCFFGATSLMEIPEIPPGQMPKNCNNLFQGCHNLRFSGDYKFYMEHVQSASGMFQDCWKLTFPKGSILDTRNVKDMSNMYRGCILLNSGEFKTDNADNVSFMFEKCNKLPNMVILSNYDIKNREGLFLHTRSTLYDEDAIQYIADLDEESTDSFDREYGPLYREQSSLVDHANQSDDDQKLWQHRQDNDDVASDYEWD